jgi:hypothetical protein
MINYLKQDCKKRLEMKNKIIPYKTFESSQEGQEVDPTDTPNKEEQEFIGYVVFLNLARVASTPGTSYGEGGAYIHIATNLYEVFEDLFTQEPIKKLDWKEHFWELMTDPIYFLPRFIDNQNMGVKCLDFRILKGFDPTVKERNFVRLSVLSPFSEVFALNHNLKNAEKTFYRLVYDHSRDNFKNEEEIKKALSQYPTLLYLLDSKPEEKERMIKELGIKDLSKIGRGLKMGLI